MLTPNYLNSTDFVEYCQQLEASTPLSIENFISSLNEKEFKLIFRQYLLNKYHRQNYLFINNSINIDNEHNQILSKFRDNVVLQQTYFNDFNIPVYLLAYLFSFLSYNELCKLASVCSGFLFAKTKYSRLCHHHIVLSHKFFVNVFRNNIDLQQHLTHFRHITIKSSYHSSEYDYRQKNNSQVFNYIIDTIIHNSSKTLEILEIDIPMNQHYGNIYYDTKILLKYIMNRFTELKQLKRLYWREYIHIVSNTNNEAGALFNGIRKQIAMKFPNLEHLHIHNLCDLKIMVPKITNLTHLTLTRFPIYHLFNTRSRHINGTNSNGLAHIAQNLVNLRELNICCTIEHERDFIGFNYDYITMINDNNQIMNENTILRNNQNNNEIMNANILSRNNENNNQIMNETTISTNANTPTNTPNKSSNTLKNISTSKIQPNMSLKKLNLSFLVNPAFKNKCNILDSVIAYSFITFPNINQFEFKFIYSSLFGLLSKRLKSPAIYRIKWKKLFELLLNEKQRYINHYRYEIDDNLNEKQQYHHTIEPLKIIKFNQISCPDICDALQNLIDIKSKYLKLEHILANIVSFSGINATKLNKIFGLIKLLLLEQQDLKKLEIFTGKGYIHTQTPEQNEYVHNVFPINSLIYYTKYIRQLLFIPNINLEYIHLQFSETKTNKLISQQLSQILSQITSIILEQIKITTKHKRFLKFWFKNTDNYYSFDQNKLCLAFFD